MIDPAGQRHGTLGALFQGRWQPHSIVTAHLHLLELASFPPVSVLLMVSPNVRGLEASALSLSAAGEVGMGSGKERGGRLCFQCQEKPQGKLCLLQWHKQTHLGRVSLITCFPPLHQMLPQIPWVSR